MVGKSAWDVPKRREDGSDIPILGICRTNLLSDIGRRSLAQLQLRREILWVGTGNLSI
jgi:hypothetical protein